MPALIGCGAPGTPSNPSAATLLAPESCVRFPGELVNSLAWDPAEAEAYVLSLDLGSGKSVIRRVDPRTMAAEVVARRKQGLATAGLAVGARGVSWSEVPASIWTFDGTVKQELRLDDPVYGLHAVPEGFLGRSPDKSPADVLLFRSDGTQSSRFHADETIRSFDASRDGRDLVVATSEDAGAPMTFVMVSGEAPVTKIEAPGHLTGGPVLRPGRRDVVYYEDHDDGSFRVLDVASGSSSVALQADVSEPRITADGRVAYTLATPGDADTVCFGTVS